MQESLTRRLARAAAAVAVIGAAAGCGTQVPEASAPRGSFASTTSEPTTDEPTTDEPTTDEPTTDEPTTDEPTTDEPTTDEPTTDEPTTDEPTTDEPTGSNSGNGLLDEPLAVGDTSHVADYELTVVDINPDAEQAVMDENQFNAPPDKGNVFVMADLKLTYQGSAQPFPWMDIYVEGVAKNGDSFTGSCGALPNDLMLVTDVEKGKPVTGTVCVQVPADKVDGMVLQFSALLAMEPTANAYYAVK